VLDSSRNKQGRTIMQSYIPWMEHYTQGCEQFFQGKHSAWYPRPSTSSVAWAVQLDAYGSWGGKKFVCFFLRSPEGVLSCLINSMCKFSTDSTWHPLNNIEKCELSIILFVCNSYPIQQPLAADVKAHLIKTRVFKICMSNSYSCARALQFCSLLGARSHTQTYQPIIKLYLLQSGLRASTSG
jgi:hypothetical protein